MPVLRDMIREMRGKSSGGIPPANEALAFAVYYAAVTSMSEEDVGPPSVRILLSPSIS